MYQDIPFVQILQKTNIKQNNRIGAVGWKLFTDKQANVKQLFDLPYFIMEALYKVSNDVINCTDIMIHPDFGARVINNANEIAHYAFGAQLASNSMLQAMNRVKIGISEFDLGNTLNQWGQYNSVVTIATSGERFQNANLYPTNNTVKLKDKISLTVGYKGGLSSRSGYAVYDREDLPNNQQDYLEKLVVPYYQAYVTWLENIHCDMRGGDLYDMVEKIIPKNQYHWSLCPGHLTSDEEWLSSPIYENSEIILKSGMLFQLDIIPSMEGYGGISGESTLAIANDALKYDIEKQYPDLWKQIQKNRNYIQDVLHIHLHQDVLPLVATLGYIRPYMLNHDKALVVKE